MNGTDRTIRVAGKATVRTEADLTLIRMVVTGTDMEYEGAIRRCAENHVDMRDRLEFIGLDREGLRTVSQRVEPHYEEVPYEDREGRQRTKMVRQGFEYEDVLSFEFPTDNTTLGRMLTVMLRAPCQPDITVSFASSDPEGSRKEALRLAAEDAREKAEILASALGCSLDCVVDVSYESGTERGFTSMEDVCLCSSMAMDDEIETDIDPQDVSFTETVEVVWDTLSLEVADYCWQQSVRRSPFNTASVHHALIDCICIAANIVATHTSVWPIASVSLSRLLDPLEW